MINAEKYLKDGVDVKQMATEMVDYFNFPPYEGIGENSIEEFFDKEVKPTLSEYEKVILRNINGYTTIIRNTENNIQVENEDGSFACLCAFNHLFQFIKLGEKYEIKELLKND